MNYPFVPIMPLIDEVRNELRTITKASHFSDEDMYGWAVDAARLIGNVAYESERQYVQLKNYVAPTPQGFYLLNNIYLCKSSNETTVVKPTSVSYVLGMHGQSFMRSSVLMPGDSSTRRFCTGACNGSQNTTLSYTIKIPPGMMRFSFKEGIIEIDYESLKKSPEGEIMIQDEPNALKAVKAYVISMLLQEKYIMQEIPRYIFADYKKEWDDYTADARNALKFPSQADMEYKALKQDARYREFRYKNQ